MGIRCLGLGERESELNTTIVDIRHVIEVRH